MAFPTRSSIAFSPKAFRCYNPGSSNRVGILILKALILSGVFIINGVVLTPARSVGLQRGDRVFDERLPETVRQAEAAIPTVLERFSRETHSDPVRPQAHQVIQVLIQAGQLEKAAKTAIRFGNCCKFTRAYYDALVFYRQALELRSLSAEDNANALNGIALIYADLNALDLAARYFIQSTEQAGDDVSTLTTALTGMADINRQQGKLVEASEYIAKAIQLRDRYHAGADATLLYVQGLVRQERDQIENARTDFSEALANYATKSDTLGQVRALCALSDLSLRCSQKQAALEYSLRGQELAQQAGKRADVIGDYFDTFEMLWRSLISHARAECALGNVASALKSYSKWMDYIEGSWVSAVATENGAVAFRERAGDPYREYVDLLVKEGRFQEAYEIASPIKAMAFLSFAGSHKPKPRAEDAERSRELRELSHLVNSLRSQPAAGLNRKQRSRVQTDLEEIEYKVEEIRLQGEMLHIHERQRWVERPNTDKLRKKMAADHMTLVEFSLGETRSLVSLFTGGEVYFETIPSRRDIENAVKPFLGEIGTSPNALSLERDLHRLKQNAAAIFAMLFGGLANKIERGQRLLVIPDGLLNYLPFEALTHDGRYLMEDHEIGYTRSASLLVQQQDSKATADGDKMDLLAFGDPVFGTDSRSSLKRKHRTSSVDVLRGSLISRGFQLPPLPRTRDEVKSISSFFPAGRTRLYLGKDSTEDALKHEALQKYRRLHFATHSLVDEKSPARSAVLLTPDAVEDGLLDMNEITDLDLDCDLVVLSACQTGRGQLLNGEGIVGLSRAFLYAGARNVVVSLWSVSDISTSRLMKDFYQQLSGNARNTEALRHAKLQMLQSRTISRHPYYWAPFISIEKR